MRLKRILAVVAAVAVVAIFGLYWTGPEYVLNSRSHPDNCQRGITPECFRINSHRAAAWERVWISLVGERR
jgi:hypothetical protein